MSEKVNRNKFKKYIIRILMGFLIFLCLLVGSGFLIIYYNQESIKKIFITELNKSLLTEISVKDFEFSVFDRFPYASFAFKGVVAKDVTKESKKDTLLQAENIYLEFSIWDIYNKKFSIKNIEIEKAKLHLKIDSKGNSNYHFWKSASQSSKKEFNFSLKKIQFVDVEFTYLNQESRQFYDFYLEKAYAKGDFSNEIQDVELKGKLIIRHLQSGDMLYLSNDHAYITAQAKINTKKEFVEIKEGDLQINDLNFALTGNISYSNENKTLNLLVKGKGIELHDFIKELPDNQQAYLEDYESKGNFDVNMSIKGLYNGMNVPLITANFSLQNGEVIHKQNDVRLSMLNFTGSYTNKASLDIQKHVLTINPFSCKLGNGTISGNFMLNDFKNPYINCQANAMLNLDEIRKFVSKGKIKNMSGKLTVSINFRGKINKEAINVRDFINSETSGNAYLSNFNMELKDDNRIYEIKNGDLQFTNNDVIINTLNGKVSVSDFNLKGSFNNVIPFIFLENQKIQVNADLYSENINLDELIGVQSQSDNKSNLHFSENYNFNLNLHVKNINYKKFRANTVSGNVKFINPVFRAENISMNSMNGNIKGNMMIDGTITDKYKISCDVTTNNADVHQIFKVFNNFGQKSITSENLNGNITSKIQFSANFNSGLEIDKKSIWSIVDLKIDNGRLIAYQPMMKLSRFIAADELKDIKFNSLENQILIKDEIISIPAMEIKSSALNLSISGEHKFNNEINYRINLLLSELISKKRKARKLKQQQAQQEFGYEEDDGLGRSKLFIKVTGTIDNPIFKYDTKSLKEKLKNDFNKEKQNIGRVLKEEFKWMMKDSADIIQEQRFKIQEKGKYVIDWEETQNLGTKIKVSAKDTLPQSGVKIKWEEE